MLPVGFQTAYPAGTTISQGSQEITMTVLEFTISRRGLLIGAVVLGAGAPRAIAAQTPVTAAFPPFIDRVSELLALVPPVTDDPEATLNIAFTFADLERQLASLGLPKPVGDALPDGFLAGTEGLPLTSNGFQFALTPEWPETFGFEPLTVDRVLEVGEPPNLIVVYKGIDPERVQAALEAAGYQEVDQETGGSYFTYGDEVDLASSVGRLGVGGMNQAAIREDAVIFTREEPVLSHVTQVIAGYAPSMLEEGDWPGLMATFAEDIVGVMALHPAILAGLGDVSSIQQIAFAIREGADNSDIWEAEDAGEKLPEPTAIADFPASRARIQVRIRYADAATASAEAEAIPRRWEELASLVNAQPLTELMLVESAGVAESDPTIAAIDFRVKGPAGRWHQLIVRLDLEAFVPAG
jgi:hypothetical protein